MKHIILGLAASAACFTARPASAEVIESSKDGFVTRDTAVTTAAPYEIWQRLLVPGKWWSDDHTWSGDSDNMYISAQGGGCFCELLPAAKDAPEGVHRGSVEHMRVMQADPPRVLRMVGALGPLQSEPVQGVLTITLKPVENGTRVLFEYVVSGYARYEPEVISKAVDGVMSLQLKRLVASLGVAGGGKEDVQGPTDENTNSGKKGGATKSPAATGTPVQGKPAPDKPAPDKPAPDKPKSPLDAEDFLLEPGR